MSTEKWSIQMSLYSMECPSHEPAFNEDDFQRIFGHGDEQPERPINVNQALEDAGHKHVDFC